jgi:hypothetical protein
MFAAIPPWRDRRNLPRISELECLHFDLLELSL